MQTHTPEADISKCRNGIAIARRKNGETDAQMNAALKKNEYKTIQIQSIPIKNRIIYLI